MATFLRKVFVSDKCFTKYFKIWLHNSKNAAIVGEPC